MAWEHQGSFNSTVAVPWKASPHGDKPAGTVQASHNLTFLRVYEAGHMVPRDQPATAQAMVGAFLAGSL